jgi:DNA-directed RNA polymerase subunit RPC12/RpoP
MAEAPRPEKVQKEPTVTKAPPAGRKFPCPQCGARLDFDPSAQGLKCPYCSYHQEVQTAEEKEVLERNYMEFLARDESKIKAIVGHTSQTTCTGCGAMVLLEDKMATEQCPFCHTHLEAKSEKVEGMIEPESVLPFKVDLRGARTAFTRWVESLWFAPNELKKIAALGELTGVYLPYWTYDSMTYSSYSGQRGDNYTDVVYYTDSNGQRQSRTVIRTNWYRVSGEVRHFFDDVLICGSKSLPLELLDKIADWPLKKLEPFRPEFLSGFKTERYAIGLKEGYKNSKDVMQPAIDQMVRQDIGGDHQRVNEQNSKFSAITFKPLLLPMWIAVYRYHEHTYQIIVNGRTAKVAGYRPYSGWKIAAFVMMCLGLLAGAIWLYVKLRRGNG